MKNKYFMAMALLAACLLGGCAEKSASVSSDLEQPQTQNVNGETKANDETKSNDETKKGAEMHTKKDAEIQTDNSAYRLLNAFGYKLFAENMEEENPVLSPVSAYTALSMAGIGAEGNTKEEFAAVMGDSGKMAELCGDIMNTLPTKSKANIVSLANSAWIDDRLEVNKEWLKDIDENMRSEVFRMRLSEQDTVKKMNKWIDDKTKGLIKEMINEPFSDEARLVLFNTLYFKAKWEYPFETADVWTDKFYPMEKFYTESAGGINSAGDINSKGGIDGTADSGISVDMMHRQSDMDYIENDFAHGIILPYVKNDEADGNFAFVALKPTDTNMKIRDMFRKLSPDAISELLAGKKTELVNMKLPKFEIEFDKELNESLINMGLNDAFDMEKADFGGIGYGKLTNSANNLYISLVRQKAKIIVDEEGTEAAAVTMVMVECGAAIMEEEPKEVFFDRPFVYMVMDMDRELPLFIGILDYPGE